MAILNKSMEELLSELEKSQNECAYLLQEKRKRHTELIIANKELNFQQEEKENRAAELIIANLELKFQTLEKEKRAAELVIADIELVFQNKEKAKRAEELIITNKELALQVELKEKWAEDLILAKKRFEDFFNLSPSLMVITNPEGKVFGINKSCNTILGYTEEEILKIGLCSLVHQEDIEKTNKVLEEQSKGKLISNFTNRYKHKNGTYKILEWEATLVKNGFTYAYANDITKRSEAGAELLLQNKEKDKRAAELSNAKKELKYQRVLKEERAEDLVVANKELAHQNKEKEKRAAELIIANKELAHQNKEKEKRAAELIIANRELAHQNKEKEKRAAELNIANKELLLQNELKEKRAAELIIANKELAYQNEEKEKRAIELVKAKEHAEESDRLKSAFLANMSHEIRTPMNGILGFSELLKTPNLSGEEQQEYIEIIEKSGNRMLNIINDIISISKIEAGLMEVYLRESNVNELIEYIYTFFKPEAEAKGITLSFKNSFPLEKVNVITDREKVFAILTNLVKNAIKYSEKGSIELGYTKKGKQLEFYVKDSGIGIDKDRQAAIFERFVQADISDKKAFQGAGLGLSISKAYVEVLGGKLWLKSEKGKGSIFYFTLPYDVEIIGQEESEIENTVKELEKPSKKLKILIVDDDEISRWLLNKMLGKVSKEVLHAENGLEAVEIFRNNPDIDLILMDLKMPMMDGYEATRQIRKINKKSYIIAQTAFAFEGAKEKAIVAGCNDYMSKPINETELIALIKKYFKE